MIAELARDALLWGWKGVRMVPRGKKCPNAGKKEYPDCGWTMGPDPAAPKSRLKCSKCETSILKDDDD
jgi:hypothetical protein